MAITVTVSASDIQVKVKNAAGDTVTRTFNDLLPVGETASIQASGNGLYYASDAPLMGAAAKENNQTDAEYQDMIRSDLYGDNPNPLANQLLGTYTGIMSGEFNDPDTKFISGTFTNKSPKTSLEFASI